jgi:hypothetical protein
MKPSKAAAGTKPLSATPDFKSFFIPIALIATTGSPPVHGIIIICLIFSMSEAASAAALRQAQRYGGTGKDFRPR